MAALLKIRDLFRQRESRYSPYKYRHFLNAQTPEKLKDILLYSESDHILKMPIETAEKKVLFINDGEHRYLFKKIVDRGAHTLVNYHYRGEADKMRLPTIPVFSVLGDIEKLSVRAGFYDVIYAPLVLEESLLQKELIAKMTRSLKNGGRVIICVCHPHWEHILYNQNPAESGSLGNSVSSYFHSLKENHLYIEDIQEGVVDGHLKPFFRGDDETDYYYEYKDLPVTLTLQAVKYVKK
jgi:hypothetical protein